MILKRKLFIRIKRIYENNVKSIPRHGGQTNIFMAEDAFSSCVLIIDEAGNNRIRLLIGKIIVLTIRIKN